MQNSSLFSNSIQIAFHRIMTPTVHRIYRKTKLCIPSKLGNWTYSCRFLLSDPFFLIYWPGLHTWSITHSSFQFSSVQSLIQSLFATPWTATHQASLSITTPRVYPNSCPLSQWCHPAISSSVIPFSSCPQSLPASGSFPMSQHFSPGGQSTGVSASTSVLPMNTQDWSPWGWTGWISFQPKGLSRVFSNTTVQKHQFQGRNRHREQTYGHWERGEEGKMYGKTNMETYITICKIGSQWEFAVWLRKLKQGLCINLEGYRGREREGGGRWEGVSKGRVYMYIHGWFVLSFDRKQQNSVEQLYFN